MGVPSIFQRRLADLAPSPEGRRWLYVPYDQLSDALGPLADAPAEELGIVLIESAAKGRRRPYHRQKLALILANQRHFALEQATRGVAVRYVMSTGTYAEALAPVIEELGSLQAMEPAEYELRAELADLDVELLPHEGWLTTAEHFEGCGGRMDRFYRTVRKDLDVLMEGGRPTGGRWSLDAENREPWHGDPEAPSPPTFEPDEITREVGAFVEEAFGDHPGTLDLGSLPATKDDAERLWAWALDACLPQFGPYEDAMSERSTGLFHTRVSALLHLHRLLPRRVIDDVLALDIELRSKEGFVRQVLGWREFVRHVHRTTDGMTTCESNHLGAEHPLPAAWWEGSPSGLHCLDTVVQDVWREGYSHHITRLMVLSNLATLLDIDPRELTDWFWVAYTDAFDWVVEPNVLGMGTYATGGLMTTKPYISGAAYIHKMSDYCGSCAFDPKKTCPITNLYWAFLARHEAKLASNHRMRMPYASLRKRDPSKRAHDADVFEAVHAALAAGRALAPEEIPS